MDKLGIFLSAERERGEGNLDRALELYRQLLVAEPDDWKIRECLADTLQAKGETREALKELFQGAHCLVHQGSYDVATRLLQKMLRMDPDHEYFVTRGVESTLSEIRIIIGAAPDQQPEEASWDETKDILTALVDDESTGDYRIPSEILSLVDSVPRERTPVASLRLVLEGGGSVEVSGKEWVIGRDEACQLVVRGEGVSERHTRILEMDGHYFAQDCASGAETLLNGRPIDIEELSSGDTLSLGASGPKVTVVIQRRE